MKYIFHIIALLLFSVIQPTWLDYISFLGIKPNLYLVYVIIVSCYCSKTEGAVLGFAAGMALDLLIGKIIGINAVMMMALGFLIAKFCDSVIRKNTLLITILIVAVIVPVYGLLYYIIAFLGDLNFKSAFVKILLPEGLCSLIAAVPLYFVIKKPAKTFWDDKGEGIG